ncbi:MAG: acyl-CoA dehydratase activase [Actinobacteria bacterium]|nr:acyl-CoA dehydratase activase [Actinomycetota bacterium]
MRVAGIDIGSRSIALAILEVEEMKVISTNVLESGFDPVRKARDLISSASFDYLVATGYGRHAAKANFADEVITEIKAFSLGSRFLFPEVRTVLDVGGQDTKAILLDERGDIVDFQMNEKCAAGTGKFLEMMALALGYELNEFCNAPFSSKIEPPKISSMCAVFAESEVISLVHEGKDRRTIAKAVHESIAERLIGILKKINYREPILFAGGVAKNSYLRYLLESRLNTKVIVPEEPQIVGALGSGLYAARIYGKKDKEARSIG